MRKALARLVRQSPALVVAVVALFVALTGTAVAATLITGAQIKNGSITGLDVKDKSLTPKDIRGSAKWATVSGAGTILRQSGGITATKVQTGGYVVTFPEKVAGRLILVTPALASDLTVRGTAIAGPCVDFAASCGVATIANSVSVFTMSTTGTQQDHSFTVAEMGPNATTAPTVTRATRSQRWLDSGK